MALKVLNLVQSLGIVNHLGIDVDITSSKVLLCLPNLQYVLKTFQANCNNSGVRANKQITEWLDAILGKKELNLVMCSTRSGI
uniref:Uncharacterized protein n=1 Tax=Arundo donax TaxID=35708 RepID=A0A0A9DNC7_ARUDO